MKRLRSPEIGEEVERCKQTERNYYTGRNFMVHKRESVSRLNVELPDAEISSASRLKELRLIIIMTTTRLRVSTSKVKAPMSINSSVRSERRDGECRKAQRPEKMRIPDTFHFILIISVNEFESRYNYTLKLTKKYSISFLFNYSALATGVFPFFQDLKIICDPKNRWLKKKRSLSDHYTEIEIIIMM